MAKNQLLTKIIDEIRYREKLTQAKIAERVGVSSQHLSDVKNGRFALSDELLNRFYVEFTYTKPQQEGQQPVTDFPHEAVPSVEITEYEYAGENRNDGVFFRDHRGQLYISVPHVEFAARGEYPNPADSLEPTSEARREIYKVDVKARGKYLSFDVQGDSTKLQVIGQRTCC